MQIQYLQKLVEYPAGRDAYGDISFENKPSSMEEILELEALYNDARKIEYDNMWKIMGIDPKDGQILKRKLKLEIHHLDDLDNSLETTLQLVTKEAHRATGGHTGSAAQIRHLFDLIINLP